MKRYLFTIVCCCLYATSYGQLDDQTGFYTQELANNLQTPSSPEAAAFMKYGDVSVNMYTGTPSINVPLYSHRGIEMSLPVSLNYDAQGIKVEEMAAWTGLKWNLVAGGRISRISNGPADDFFQATGVSTFFTNDTFRQNNLNLFNTVTFNSSLEVSNYFGQLKNLAQSGNDMQPDYYSINAPAMNGYATFNLNTMEMEFIDNIRGKITYQKSGNVIESITVTGDDGTVCVFGGVGAQEITETTNYDDTGAGSGAGTKRFISSWLLKRIESPNKKDIYEFEYFTPLVWDQDFRASRTTHVVNSYRQDPSNNYNAILGNNEVSSYGEEHNIEQLFLQRIKHNGRVFIENEMAPREDIASDDPSALSKMTIFDWCEGETTEGNCNNEVLRSITFDYSYFNVDTSIGETPQSKDYDAIRLKLDAVNFLGKDNVRYQQYRMEYVTPEDLPTRTSLAQDYLGYYNGKGNSDLFPAYTTERGDFLAGADRSPDEGYALIGTLKRMYYPTGGFTEFDFELHRSKDINTTQTLTETVSASSLGTETTDIGACADQFEPEGGAVVRSRTLSLAAGTYDVSFTTPTGDAMCYLIPITDLSSPVSFADICNGTVSTSSFAIDNPTGTPLNQSIVLLGGNYQMIAVIAKNGGGSAILTLSQEVTTPVENLKAGIRVKQVTDYTKENTVARTKNYNYTNDDGSSSGIVVNEPVLVYATNTFVANPQSGGVDALTSIHRLTSASGAGEPHVAYSRIEEVISDSGKTVMRFNVGETGVMSTPAPTSYNYYQTNIANANGISTQVFTIDNQLLSESTTEYFEAVVNQLAGYGVANDPTRAYKYILVSDQGNGTFAFSYVDPDWSCFGGASVCDVFPTPPAVCNLEGNTCFEREFAVLEPFTRGAQGKLGGPSRVVSTQYPDPSNPLKKVVTTTETTYDVAVDYLPRETRMTDSEGKAQVSVSFYPKDAKHPSHQNLVNHNKLAMPVQSEGYESRNGVLHKTMERQSTYTTIPEVAAVDVPLGVYTAKDTDPLELRVNYTDYDVIGNLGSIEQERGVPTAVLWGYDHSRMIAKVSNAEFRKLGAEVTSTGSQAINEAMLEFVSDADLQNLTGDALRTILDLALRNNPKFSGMVTTYTHKPQVGITTMTDTRGYTIFYEYDAFLRLKAVRDADGNLLSTNEYNYQTQQ